MQYQSKIPGAPVPVPVSRLTLVPIHQVLCHAVCIKIYVSIELKTCLGLADSFKNLRLLSAGVLGGLAASSLSYFDILKTPINARGDPCLASTAPPAAETVMGTPAPLHSGDVLPKVLPLAPSVSLERNLSPAMEAHVQAVYRELALKYHPAAFSGHSKCTGVENVRIDSGPQLTQDKGSMSEAKFFYVMIKVQTNKTGDFCCQTESVASALKKYAQQNTVEGVMVQSIEEEGRLLTLCLAIKFAALHDRMRLWKYLR
jgi:hypothetical protein